jgi:hypothetical protein
MPSIGTQQRHSIFYFLSKLNYTCVKNIFKSILNPLVFVQPDPNLKIMPKPNPDLTKIILNLQHWYPDQIVLGSIHLDHCDTWVLSPWIRSEHYLYYTVVPGLYLPGPCSTWQRWAPYSLIFD